MDILFYNWFKGFPIILLLFLFSQESFGQVTITGRVVDAETGKALEFATVFVSNSTFGDITDGNGVFKISIPEGSHELVISFIGYQTFGFTFHTKELREAYEFRILPEPLELEVTVVAEKRDRAWYKNLEIFRENFLGSSINAENCKIINPEVLILDAETGPGVLKASANDILEIQNPNLGYTIRYVLTGFEYRVSDGKVAFAGYPFFVGQDVPQRRMTRLGKNRDRAFRGSIAHLMRSLYLGTVKEEGFELFAVERTPNPDRPDDNQILEAKTRLEETRRFLERDSLKHEIAKENLPKFIDNPTETLLDPGVIIQTTEDGKVFLTFDQPFYVVFKNENEEPNYRKHSNRDVRNRMNTTGIGIVTTVGMEESLPQVTRVQMQGKAVQIFRDGSYFHPYDIYLEGYMAWEKIGDLMPFDYGIK